MTLRGLTETDGFGRMRRAPGATHLNVLPQLIDKRVDGSEATLTSEVFAQPDRASRALDVVLFLASHPDDAFSYSELAERLDINLASLHAVLHALEDRRFVARDAASRRYTLGLSLVATGDAALRHHHGVDALRRQIAELRAELGLACVAVAPVRTDLLCVAASHSDASMMQVGQRVPWLAPFGAVFVAWSDLETIRPWLRRSGISGLNRRQALAALETIRRRGYSATVDHPGHDEIQQLMVQLVEYPSSSDLWRQLRQRMSSFSRTEATLPAKLRDITAPVFGENGLPLMSLSLQGLPSVLSTKRLEVLAARLLVATGTVTAAVGGVVPPTVGPAQAPRGSR